MANAQLIPPIPSTLFHSSDYETLCSLFPTYFVQPYTQPQPPHSPDCERLGASFDMPPLQPDMQLQQSQIQPVHVHHSKEFKFSYGKCCRKVSMLLSSVFLLSDLVKDPLAAEEYIAHSQLSLAAAQTRVINANNNLIKKRFQEYQALMKIVQDGGNLTMLDPSTALTVSRLARATLCSEYYLAVCKRNACQQELVVLQNAEDEAFGYFSAADRQVAQVYNLLHTEGINIPKPPPFTFPETLTYGPPKNFFFSNYDTSADSGYASGSGGVDTEVDFV